MSSSKHKFAAVAGSIFIFRLVGKRPSGGSLGLHSVAVMGCGGVGQVLGWHLLRTRWGLDRAFGIEPAVLGRWLAFVEVRAAAFAAGRSRFRVLRTWPRAQGNPGADVLAKSCELCWERFVACANRLRVGLTQRFLWPNQRRQWLSRVGLFVEASLLNFVA